MSIIEKVTFRKDGTLKKEIHDAGYTKYYRSGRIKQKYYNANKATYNYEDDTETKYKVEYFSNARVRTDHNGNEHVSYL